MDTRIPVLLAEYPLTKEPTFRSIDAIKRIGLVVYDGDTSSKFLAQQLAKDCCGLVVHGFEQMTNPLYDIERGCTTTIVEVHHWVEAPIIKRAKQRRAVRRRLLPWTRRSNV